MNIYISGPMRGYPNYNRDAFDRAAVILRMQGHQVHSPSEYDRWDTSDGKPEEPGRTMAHNLDASLVNNWADALVCLEGWTASEGAGAEVGIAKWRGLKFYKLRPDGELVEFLPVSNWTETPLEGQLPITVDGYTVERRKPQIGRVTYDD
jgi:hypothetical protein